MSDAQKAPRKDRPGTRVTQLADGLVQCRTCGMTEDYEHANDHWWWISTSLNGMTGEWECPDCEHDREQQP